MGLVFATREVDGDLASLRKLVVGGLPEKDARALLDSVLTGSLDARVRDQIVADAGGNPLALLELPRGLTVAELAGGFGLPGAMPVPGRVEESFERRVAALPAWPALLSRPRMISWRPSSKCRSELRSKNTALSRLRFSKSPSGSRSRAACRRARLPGAADSRNLRPLPYTRSVPVHMHAEHAEPA